MKKGFTLIELLAVILLLAIIALIAYPTLNNVISKNKDKLYDKQIEELKRHTNTWIMGNSESFELEEGESYLLSFEELYKFGLLDTKEVKDPRNSENLPGCMVLTRNSVNYDIEYNEECKVPKRVKNCTFDGELVQGAEFTDGQYTYRYKQYAIDYIELMDDDVITKFGRYWEDMSDDGWSVTLEDKLSTEPVTTKICTSINDMPITNMNSMFIWSQAPSIDLSSFDTSNVTDMSNMFYGSQAKSLNLSGFDTSKVTLMRYMFFISEATNINISSFDTSNVIDMAYMFSSSQATTLNLSSFNTSEVIDMCSMFYGSKALSIDLSSFDTANVLNMTFMFQESEAPTLDLSSFDTSNVSDDSFGYMFHEAKATTGYARTQADADKFNGSSGKPDTLTFVVK